MQTERLDNPRILIVDDVPKVREEIQNSLGKANPNWTFFTAASVREATEVVERQLARKEPIAVVLTDLELETGRGDTGGMDVIRAVRQLDPLLMVILFTGYNNLLDRYGALERGAFDVIAKSERGAAFFQEVNVKTRSALKYRALEDRVHFLRRYFDPRLFEMIERDPSLLELKMRTVTVCFWDISGSSRLSEQLAASPKLVSGFLRDYYDATTAIVHKHLGVVERFIGDGVMAVFGVFSPEAEPGPPAVAAVQAAKEVRIAFDNTVAEWKTKWVRKAPHQFVIGLRCGIHTGEALVGNVGTVSRDVYTALGWGVNLASRIEKLAKGAQRQILMSETTHSFVDPPIRTRHVGTTPEVTDIPGPFDLYEVEG